MLINLYSKIPKFFPADPYYFLRFEKMQFDEKLPMGPSIFKPFFNKNDSTSIFINYKS